MRFSTIELLRGSPPRQAQSSQLKPHCGHKYPPKESVAKRPAASCKDCHSNDAKQEYGFTQYDPVL